jgi:hypothetical protein
MLSEGEINGTLLNCDSCAWQCFHASKSVFYVFKIFNTNDSLIKILKAFDFIQKNQYSWIKNIILCWRIFWLSSLGHFGFLASKDF